MNRAARSLARRDLLRSAGGLIALMAGGSLLGGCGGEEAAASSEPISFVPGPGSPAAGAASPLVIAKPETSWLNFALVMQYVGAQFYTLAASGVGVPPGLQGGIGVQGVVQGGRRVAFVDPDLAQYIGEFGVDQVAVLTDIRARLGPAAAAQPAIDLSTDAFGALGRATKLGGQFDPFAGDTEFLIGGLIVEHAVSGAYRSMLTTEVAGTAEVVLTKAMGDSIYRTSLIRALLAAKAEADPALASTLASVFAALARLEASPTSQEPQSTDQASSSVSDGDGQPVPLTRSANEVFRLLYLNAAGASGGLLPLGVNGIDLLPGMQ